MQRECLKVGITPREVDDLYHWEIAVALGTDQLDFERDPHHLLRARLAHSQGRGEKPEAPVMSAAEYNELINVLGPMAVG